MKQRKIDITNPHYYPEKLKRKLDKLRYAPATFVVAPSGYGKTTVLRDFFEADVFKGTSVYWFTAADEAPSSAFRRLCRKIEKIDRNAGELLIKIKLPNSVNIGEAIEALNSIRCTHESYLVIDNFQLIQELLPPAFFTALFEHRDEKLHIIFVTQMLKRNMHAAITGKGFLHIGAADLRLSAEEIRCYYSLAEVDISPEDAQMVANYTEGWIIAVYLQLCAFREKGKLSDTVGILALMDALVWTTLTEKQKTFLLYLSPFEIVTIHQACTLNNLSTLPEYASNALSIPFIHYDSAGQQYELHSILTDLLIQKCKERGAVFERECLLRAGDFCRAQGEAAEALGFYAQIKDYERMLSTDISHMTLEMIGNKPFSELAYDIVNNCPLKIKKKYILSMLQIAWTLCMAGMKDQFHMVMEELHEMDELHKDTKLMGEWLLLSSYRSFPCITEMTSVLKQAVPFLKGKCSRVILPTVPWCFGNYSYMTVFHANSGEAEQEAYDLEEYIAIYSRLTNGHGSGADVSFRAELAYHRGDISTAEILCYKASFIAESNKQNIVQLGVTMYLAEIALHKGDASGWQNAIASMERASTFPGQDTFVSRRALDIIRGILLNELGEQNSISDWLKKADFEGYSYIDPMVGNALFVKLNYLLHKGEHPRVIGAGQAILEKNILKNPYRKSFLCLVMAASYSAMKNYKQAAPLVENAAELLLPDGLVFPLATYSLSIGEWVGEIIDRKYPQLYREFQAVRERFAMGWTALHEVMTFEEIPSDLTPREYEVAKLASMGLHNNEIAKELSVTESTVRAHLRVVFQKLQIDRRAKLAEKLK
jgi:LuxR family maltose regulon positive regulatory protein